MKWNKSKVTKIYVLHPKNSPNEIRYVGKTCQSLKERWYHHIHEAKCPKYSSKNNIRHVLNWIRSINFNIEITQIDSTSDWTEGEELEKHYIKEYKEKGYNLCNHTIGGDGATPKYGSDNSNSKKVLQYDLNGVFLAVFSSRVDAGNLTGVKESLISGCVNEERIKSAGGYIWKKYEKDYPLKIESYREIDGRWETRKKAKSCEISKFSKKGELLKIYKSIHLAAKEERLNAGNLRKVSQGKFKTCGGFIWKRTNYGIKSVEEVLKEKGII